jgi:hypothetical protein
VELWEQSSSRNHEDVQQAETLKPESTATALQAIVSESHQVTRTDVQSEMMKGFQMMQEANREAMKEMQRESLKVMVETLHHLAGAQAPQQAPVPHLKAIGKKPTNIRKGGGSNYEEPIRKLLKEHPTISATEAGRRVECSHVTAGKILAGLRVTITEVSEEQLQQDERETENATPPFQSESA